MNQNQFLLDSGFWGWLYKLLYPVEWLMTQIMAVFHKFLVMLGMNEIGFSWVMSIVFLVLVVQACVFPLFYKSMKGMRKMQAQMTVLQPKMQRIQNKYKGKNDPASKEAMQREMMKLYQDNDANPMGGCTSMLPMFVQGPVFMCMFYTLSAIPYIARGKFRDGQGLGAFDIATAKQFTELAADVGHVFQGTDSMKGCIDESGNNHGQHEQGQNQPYPPRHETLLTCSR